VRIAVVGGTGTAGAAVVDELTGRGHDVRVLSRRAPDRAGSRAPVAAAHHRVDLLTGDGLAEGVDGMDAVVDASKARSRLARIRRVLVEGTGRLLRAEADMGIRDHLLISIVGIDAVPFSYYRIKLSQEATVSGGRVPWSIVRCTQFHPLVDEIFALFSRVGLLPRSAVPLQPIDPSDVAVAVVDRLEAGPSLGRTRWPARRSPR
jgi:uncharacterized protein YbjT (DUF2867 family)